MTNEMLLLIIAASAFFCLVLERNIAWLSHVSGVGLLILVGMVLSFFDIVPAQSDVYDFLQGPVVLIGLVMMTVGLHLNDVIRVPWKTLVVFAAGICGTVFGGLIAGYVGSWSLGGDSYKLAAQLTASYIGGGENAVAMQKIFDIPKEYFVAIFAIDNIVTSLWMAICVWLASDRDKEVNIDDKDASNFDGTRIDITSIIGSIFISMAVVWLAQIAATKIGFIHKILWMSIFALIAGHIPGIRIYLKAAYVLGASLFTGFFFSIGAMSDLSSVVNLPFSIIAMPFIVVGVHGLTIIPIAYFLGVSRISTMVASQALIGGPATSVAVAQARKWKSGISIGIILGVFGYAVANFFGVFVYNLLQFLWRLN